MRTRHSLRGASAVTLVLALLVSIALGAVPAAAHEPDVRLPPADECDGAVPIIVASDAAAQSDIYAAVMLADVLAPVRACVVLAGSRSEPMPADQLSRLCSARSYTGYVVGGLKAVPEAKRFGRASLSGTDRWETSRAVAGEATRLADGGTLPSADGAASAPCTVGTGFASASAGAFHTCGLRTDGTVDCWGFNENGETDAPSGSFAAVSGGFTHTCGIRTDGTIACWGNPPDDGSFGQAIPPSGAFVAVTAGAHHSCGVRTDTAIDCWGFNRYGQAPPWLDANQ